MIIEQKQRNRRALQVEIRTSQAIDTGMAMVLIGLLACWISGRDIFLITSIGLLLMNMIWPRFYVPAAKLWLGFSTILGAFMAKIVMVVIFVCIVSPIALIRRVAGGDSLQLKKWKASRESVFTERNHKYSSDDIDRLY